MPGQFIPGADSHSRAYGAYGAVGMGVGSTTLGFGWATGYIYFTLAKARRVVVNGRLQPWVSGKDIVLELLRRWGSQTGAGDVSRVRGSQSSASDGLSKHDRQHDGRSRSAERHFCGGRNHSGLVRGQGDRRLAVSARVAWSRRRDTRSTRSSRSMPSSPMIAKPFSPGNAFRQTRWQPSEYSSTRPSSGRARTAATTICSRRRSSCTTRGDRGSRRPSRPLVVFPGSGGVARLIERPDARLGGESIADVFRRAGGQIRQSWCGPCFGQGPDALRQGNGRSRPSTATGRTAWAWAAKVIWPARPSSPPPRWPVTWPPVGARAEMGRGGIRHLETGTHDSI